ncbi:MAG: hypothetical protein NC433_06000 [Clostridiales bacterium]|nr:hypothetical protein [Clostridiales bacterium]
MYRQKSITYGNGRVTLRRVSKECVNGTGTPVGKWKNREDTFLLDELETYGVSRQVLGYELEYDRARMRDRYNLEIFFQLKDGKKLAYEMSYHTHKQIKEFLNYIHEETGLEFQKAKPAWKRK